MQPYYPRRILAGLCGLLVLVLYVVSGVAWGQSDVCTFGTVPCQGGYGGGCYNPAYATCHNGLICSHALAPCVGQYGAGCYNPAYATCSNGLVCATPLQPCFGRHGAQCFDPGRATCEAGQSQRRFRSRP